MQQNTTGNNKGAVRQQHANIVLLFAFLWALLFVVYYPAAKAGFVTDFTGWLDQVKNHSFAEYINRTNFHVHSLYQFTQFNTWVFYQLFGIGPWPWHLLFITLHALNACLLFSLCNTLLQEAGVANSWSASFAGALLFCVSPYISEVIVWEPSFHFLQGLLLILLVLIWVQKYANTGNIKYAWYAGVVYLLSTFSLEIFYITPWLVFTLALYYFFHATGGKALFKKITCFFFIPELLVFCLRMLVYKVAYGDWVSRIGAGTVSAVQFEDFSKPPKYLFHLLFLGRFFPNEMRQKVYAFCDSFSGIVLFYGVVAFVCAYIITRFRKMGGKGKVASLLFIWTLIALLLLVPLWFSDILLVLFDRYTYFTGAFLYMLLAVLAGCISIKYIRIGFIASYALINLRFAIKVSRYWGKSYRVDYALLNDLPDPGNKTVLLLNLPESMNGIPMIGSDMQSEYKFMRDLLLPGKKINNTVHDVLSYNMITPGDGAHAVVVNDSTIHVTLNQWGTWWWFAGKGGYSYENNDYKLNLIDPGHFYELKLKKPAEGYLLLYQVGDQWRAVDMSRKKVDQY